MASEPTHADGAATTEQAFFEAIRNRQFGELRKLVAAAPSLLMAYDEKSFGATPLTLATLRQDRDAIDVLIDLKVDVDRPSDWWAGPWTPLHCAIYFGNDELAEHLITRGATLDVHAAASLNRLDDLRELLNESPERVSERGGDGCQPLHFAGTIEAAEILLDYGADIEARDVDHFSTPVQYLAHPRPEVARFLFSKGAASDVFSAVLAEDAVVLKSLLANNPKAAEERINQDRFPPGPEHDVHNIMTFVVGVNGTPMHAAAKGNRPSMVDVLVSAGADVDARGGYDDATALHVAAWDDNAEVAAALLASGADINIRSGSIHNNSPAGWAIVAGSAQVFQVLMDHGAEQMEWFARDAEAAVNGEFLKFKSVPTENYARILERLNS